MKKIIFLICMLFSLPLAYAEPTVNGPTGLIDVPTAEALKLKEWNIGLSLHPDNNDDDSRVFCKYQFNLGALNNMELGFIGRNNQEGVFINTKFFLLTENTEYPLGLALGLQNLASFHNAAVYLVASKKFKQSFTGHLGFTANLQDHVRAQLMTGMELFILNNRMSLLTDIAGTEDVWKFNFGTRFFLSPEFTLGVYLMDIFNVTPEKTSISGQISWTDYL